MCYVEIKVHCSSNPPKCSILSLFLYISQTICFHLLTFRSHTFWYIMIQLWTWIFNLFIWSCYYSQIVLGVRISSSFPVWLSSFLCFSLFPAGVCWVRCCLGRSTFGAIFCFFLVSFAPVLGLSWAPLASPVGFWGCSSFRVFCWCVACRLFCIFCTFIFLYLSMYIFCHSKKATNLTHLSVSIMHGRLAASQYSRSLVICLL